MEVVGIVKNGIIVVPPSVQLPEGSEVRVVWDPAVPVGDRRPLERQALTEAAIDADIAWANGKRFGP